ncbi:hypothetical protein BN1723_020605, partial [Verticillium longisporum]
GCWPGRGSDQAHALPP